MEDTRTEGPEKPGISVRYSATTPEEHPQMYAHALKVEVLASTDYPDHLFVFQRSKENNEGDLVDEFIQIASPLEIEEVPEDAPRPEDGMPYYRTKTVTLWFRNMEDLLLAKTRIKDDIRTLVSTLEVINGDLDEQEVERYE